jgi:hypothetical protein
MVIALLHMLSLSSTFNVRFTNAALYSFTLERKYRYRVEIKFSAMFGHLVHLSFPSLSYHHTKVPSL